MDHRTEYRSDREGDFVEVVFYTAFLLGAFMLAAEMSRAFLGVADQHIVLAKALMAFAFCMYGEFAAPPDPTAPVATSVIVCIFALTLYMVSMVAAMMVVQPHFPLRIQAYLVLTALYCLFGAGAACLTAWVWRRA